MEIEIGSIANMFWYVINYQYANCNTFFPNWAFLSQICWTIKEFHKDLFSALCFSMFFLLMIYFIVLKLSCLQIMQMITLFPDKHDTKAPYPN